MSASNSVDKFWTRCMSYCQDYFPQLDSGRQFPVVIPSLFIPKYKEFVKQTPDEQLAGGLEELQIKQPIIKGVKANMKGDDAEEAVYNSLVRYGQKDRNTFMIIFHGLDTTKCKNILNLQLDFGKREFDFFIDGDQLSVNQRKKATEGKCQSKKEFDFIILREDFAVVVEVKSISELTSTTVAKIQDCFDQLRTSTAFVRSLAGHESQPITIYRIVCCPNLTHIALSQELKNKAKELNLFFVCDIVKLDANLLELLDKLSSLHQSGLANTNVKQLAKLLIGLFYSTIIKTPHETKEQRLMTDGQLRSDETRRIEQQDVGGQGDNLMTNFVRNQSSGGLVESGWDHPVCYPVKFLTPQQHEALIKEKLILLGAAGTGKTLLIMLKAFQRLQRGEQIVIIAPDQLCLWYKRVFNGEANVRVWSQDDIGKKFPDLIEVANYLKSLEDAFDKLPQTGGRRQVNRITAAIADVMREKRYDEDFVTKWLIHLVKTLVSSWTRSMSEEFEKVQKLWTITREQITNHWFMRVNFLLDDAFSVVNDKFADIFLCLLLEFLCNETVLKLKQFCCIAGDVCQLYKNVAADKSTYSFRFLMKRQDNYSIILSNEKYMTSLNAVMRCSKSVFNYWGLLHLKLCSFMSLKHYPTLTKAELGHKFVGEIVEGSVRYEKIDDLVEEICLNIRTLITDNYLSLSDFAVLFCNVDSSQVITAGEFCMHIRQLLLQKNIVSQPISETQMISTAAGPKNDILTVDTYINALSYEWTIVFAVYIQNATGDTNDIGNDDLLSRYVAMSRARVQLFSYETIPAVFEQVIGSLRS